MIDKTCQSKFYRKIDSTVKHIYQYSGLIRWKQLLILFDANGNVW